MADRSGTRRFASNLVLFGATGDLAQRMLLPSLFALDREHLLPEDFRILAAARSDMDTAGYRALADEALVRHCGGRTEKAAAIDRFVARLSYLSIDVSRPEDFLALKDAVRDWPPDLAIFLSTAPHLFGPTIAGLADAGLAGPGTRLALEKPLGTDGASARAINDAVAAVYSEAQTFRIDHYLGKETVQNLLALRFGNLLFEPLWNARGISDVQITVAETVGLEQRAGYYDGVGALRDMVQNHLLQLLSLVSMEPPARFDAAEVRDEKVKVLRALRPITGADVLSHTVIGSYGPGAIGDRSMAGYVDELGRPSNTETFVAIKAHVDTWRWHGVPFYLRTGKRMPVRHSEIFIRFKRVPHSIFAGQGPELTPNGLLISLQPEESITLTLMAKRPGLDREGVRLREVPLDLKPGSFVESRRRIAYERLLLDLLEGDPTLFVRRDEVEAQWRWIDGIRAGWEDAGMTPKSYPSGSWGPVAAIALAERDGVSWRE